MGFTNNGTRGGFLGGSGAGGLDLSAGGTIAGNVVITGTLQVDGASTLTGDIAAGNINMASGKKIGIEAGDASNPSVFVNGSTSTGMYSPGANQLGFTRGGTQQIALVSGANALTGSQWTVSQALLLNAGFRLISATPKTADYTATATDRSIVMAVVAGGNLTMPVSPATFQRYEVWNQSANPLTLVRGSGQTMNGVAANPTIAAGAMAIMQLDSTSSNWLISEAPPA